MSSGIPCHPDGRHGPGYPRIDDDWLAAPYATDHRQGHVYFIAETCGPVKIGYGSSPWERLACLQVGNCRQLFLLSYVKAPREAERRLHDQLSEHWLTGEWYAPEPEVFAAIDATERVFGATHREECDECRRDRVAVERDIELSWRRHHCGEWRRER